MQHIFSKNSNEYFIILKINIMKKTIKLFTGTLIIALTMFIGSCKKCIPIVPPSTDSVNVYVAGWDNINPKNYVSAKYWKNEVPVVLSQAQDLGYANSIAISGTDVYVAGYEVFNATTYQAVYWKNGTKVLLTNGSYDAYATSIAVSGPDLYVAGYENNGRKYVAKYWKNGSPINLTNGSHDAYANSIVVSGPDVYVAGYENNGAMNPYPNNGLNDVAKYWKNGSPIVLSNPANSSGHAESITVVGNDVYVAGQEDTGIAPNTRNLAKYWKNGISVILSKVTEGNARATSIAVSGNDVYVAGYQFEGLYYEAEYWKNGQQVILSANTGNAVANSIAIYGTDVYVAGYQNIANNTLSVAEYWKNGSPVLLTNANGSHYASATSIVVVKQ